MDPEFIVDGSFLLERFSGKGGWTFARIPSVTADKKYPFGWRRVSGTIDGYAISKYHLMPMGDGILFLPVKAEIRKAIGKQAGDTVHLRLYADETPLEIPAEMLECLKDEPAALKFFSTLSDSEQRYYIQWVYNAKREETKVSRMAKAVNRMADGLKMHKQPPKNE